MNFLTELERDQLKFQQRRERDRRVYNRTKAALLHDKGWSPKEIVRVLLISNEAVRNHIAVPSSLCSVTGIPDTEHSE